MIRSIFSQRYNYKITQIPDVMNETFRYLGLLPKGTKLAEVQTEPTSSVITKPIEKECATKDKEKTEWYYSDEIPITTRYELEGIMGIRLMERYSFEDAKGTFSHVIWKTSETDTATIHRCSLKKAMTKSNLSQNKKNHQSDKPTCSKVKNSSATELPTTLKESVNQLVKIIKDPKPTDVGDKSPNTEQVGETNETQENTESKSNSQSELIEANVQNERKNSKSTVVCDQCNKVFQRNWLLRNHMRLHTGEKPYACPFITCKQRFADRSNLIAHQRTRNHHDWIYKCKKCTKPFSSANNLKRHKLKACRKYLQKTSPKGYKYYY